MAQKVGQKTHPLRQGKVFHRVVRQFHPPHDLGGDPGQERGPLHHVDESEPELLLHQCRLPARPISLPGDTCYRPQIC